MAVQRQALEELRLTPVAKPLSELLGSEVKKADEAHGDAVKAIVSDMNEGDVLLLEKTYVFIRAKRKMIQR